MFWIHIGLNKTGTTTIQSFMRQNAGQLEGLGYRYPVTGDRGPSAHYHLARELRDVPEKGAGGESWGQLSNWQIQHPDRHLIVSCEGLFRLQASRITDLAERIAGTEPRIVVYLRRQSALMESWYMQRLKTGRSTDSFDTFARKNRDTLVYSEMLKGWVEAFGKDRVIIRIYDRPSLVNGDVIDDFLDCVGLPLQGTRPDYMPVESLNDSPGPRSLALAQLLFGIAPTLGNRKRRRKREDDDSGLRPKQYLQLLDMAMQALPDERRTRFLSYAERARFDAAFERDNSRVARRYRPDLEGELFTPLPADNEPANYTTYQDVLTGVPSDELIRATGQILSRLGSGIRETPED